MNTQRRELQSITVEYPDTLEIIDSPFWTIQGEGPFVGRPAVFIRTAGCVLACPECDTIYTTGRNRMSFADILGTIQNLKGLPAAIRDSRGQNLLIVITGGEPFRQAKELLDFMCYLDRYLPGCEIQIETNGMLAYVPQYYSNYAEGLNEFLGHYGFVMRRATIVCSPKNEHVSHVLLPYINYWKYIAHHMYMDGWDGLPTQSLGYTTLPYRSNVSRQNIFLQPAFSEDPDEYARNLKMCVKSCLTFGYRLSLQTHKLIGLP